MTLELPDLDERTYAEFLADARKRIPVYAEEWTDHNAHDPGVTILELLAWLTETYGYQLDQITDAHRLKYVQLLCGRNLPSTTEAVARLLPDPPRPPEAATVDLQLDVPAWLAGETVDAGTSLSASRSGDAPMAFETNETTVLTGATIGRIVSTSPGGHSDHTIANGTPGLSFNPFGPDAAVGNAMYLGFDSDPFAGDADVLDLFVEYDEEGLPPPAKHGDELSTFVPSVRVAWQFCKSYANWRASSSWVDVPVEDATEQFHRGGRVRLAVRDRSAEWTHWRTKSKPLLGSGESYRWLRAVVETVDTDATTETDETETEDERRAPKSLPPCEPKTRTPENRKVPPRHDIPPRIKTVRVNVVTARHRTTVSVDAANAVVLRQSDGGTLTTARPRQRFEFPQRPILQSDTVAVALRDLATGEVDTEWKAVPSLDVAGPNEQVYVLDHGSGSIQFGDGIRGSIPPADVEVISTEYEAGGGRVGNVSQSADWTIARADVEAVSPLADAHGGTDEETIDEALGRVRRDLRTPYRAVSLADYRYVAAHTPGLRVGRVAASVEDGAIVAGCEPQRRVHVVVVPYNRSARPEPSAGFLDAVECHLNRHALLTDTVTVSPPSYVGVGVRTVVSLDPGSSLADREQAIMTALDAFLDPLRGYDGNGWPFGRPVYRSELYDLISRVDGVDCAIDLSMTVPGGRLDTNGNVDVGEMGLVYPTVHEVVVQSERDTCAAGGSE